MGESLRVQSIEERAPVDGVEKVMKVGDRTSLETEKQVIRSSEHIPPASDFQRRVVSRFKSILSGHIFEHLASRDYMS